MQKKILIRLDENSLDKLNLTAKKMKMSREKYIRKMLKENILIPTPNFNYFDLIKKTNAIGQEINNLAFKSNISEYVNLDILKMEMKKLENLSANEKNTKK